MGGTGAGPGLPSCSAQVAGDRGPWRAPVRSLLDTPASVYPPTPATGGCGAEFSGAQRSCFRSRGSCCRFGPGPWSVCSCAFVPCPPSWPWQGASTCTLQGLGLLGAWGTHSHLLHSPQGKGGPSAQIWRVGRGQGHWRGDNEVPVLSLHLSSLTRADTHTCKHACTHEHVQHAHMKHM